LSVGTAPQRKSPEEVRREIDRADAVTAALASAVLDLTLARCASPNRFGQAQRIRELIGAKAWTDAAIALVELDSSHVLRPIGRDDGEWRCVIGSRWALPEWLDDTVESSHAVMPLAILGTLLAAFGQCAAPRVPAASVPGSRPDTRDVIATAVCENF